MLNFFSYLSTNLLLPRNSKWSKIRKQFLKDNGNICACCGRTNNLNVHHIIPVHINRDLELDVNNLIILCENHCHFFVGHLGDWKAYNFHVKDDVVFWGERIRGRLYS